MAFYSVVRFRSWPKRYANSECFEMDGAVLTNAVVVIPARLASSRFPGKILACETGKYLIQHVYEQACKAKKIQKVIIAADDERTMSAAKKFGAPAVMTDPNLPSGTDRVAAVVREMDVDIVVNVQGDEPRMKPEAIDQLVDLMTDGTPMATLATPLESQEEIANPNCVKVVLNKNNDAIYFSRSIIPFPRDGFNAMPPDCPHLLHLGIYAYRKELLLKLTSLEPSPIEKIEMLEQLRALWNGYRIKVGITPYRTQGIDTPEQYKIFVDEFLHR
jgi:3-deoxy-manno-octulosonate cytidylyltransferase (CMP-KDO synthetase)